MSIKKYIAFFTGLITMFGFGFNETESVSADSENYEYAMFPANVVDIYQGAYSGFSHGKLNAFDITLPDSDSNLYAPFTGTVTMIDEKYNAVILQSSDKVYWADGTLDYMSVCVSHDNDISDLYVGKEIQQGEVFYQPGVKSPINMKVAHVHLNVNRGQTNAALPDRSGDVLPNEALFVVPEYETGSRGDGGYTWTVLENHSTENDTDTNDASGDVNGDEIINTNDIVSMIDYILGKNESINKDAADMNGDGTVNISDLIILKSDFLK